ncbi:HAMP domain-containing sensor histidine kinase [Azoarcus sp. DN11]|uniref:sensor histidine kinase n=1 Tax=Azoarcus sp. DN11 TaxID=356837 RepID=UPI000EAF7517|nr:HAMP domain-containing sensor histidine kinase [Azoarcus sp. DN11]AYH42438.1 two-component sensor histidine kinase [Azoarcus sp. DN11]
MRLGWARTLFARLMLIWLGGMVVVLAVSFALFVSERDRYAREVLLEGVVREVATAVDVLDHMPADERENWINAAGRRRMRYALAPPPPDATAATASAPLAAALRDALPGHRVEVLARNTQDDEHPHRMHAFVSLSLDDGTPLLIRMPGPMFGMRPPFPPGSFLTSLLALLVGVTLLTWFAVRIATRPITRLAAAADALGEDPNRAPLEINGPAEAAQAAHAFNRMQERILQHVSERTRILAAISHDLQTPITRLRLRAELIDDEALRAKFQSDLDAMQALAKEGLDYARSLDGAAPKQTIDLNALVAALRDDAQDMGWDVDIAGDGAPPCLGQLGGLRRALWNLIENGHKFGRRVRIVLQPRPDACEIAIADDGPGLPQEELEKVFEPFYRVESSRSRDTGGTGLGLAIARNLLRAQGGEVRLANRPEGGLEAVVTLPRAMAAGGQTTD